MKPPHNMQLFQSNSVSEEYLKKKGFNKFESLSPEDTLGQVFKKKSKN